MGVQVTGHDGDALTTQRAVEATCRIRQMASNPSFHASTGQVQQVALATVGVPSALTSPAQHASAAPLAPHRAAAAVSSL
jgi:hypothetical protein